VSPLGAHYNKKMEQMMIKLLGLKLQRDKHEVENLELETKLESIV